MELIGAANGLHDLLVLCVYSGKAKVNISNPSYHPPTAWSKLTGVLVNSSPHTSKINLISGINPTLSASRRYWTPCVERAIGS